MGGKQAKLSVERVTKQSVKAGDHIAKQSSLSLTHAIYVNEVTETCAYLDTKLGIITETSLSNFCPNEEKLRRFNYPTNIHCTNVTQVIANVERFLLYGKFGKNCLTTSFDFVYSCKTNKYTSNISYPITSMPSITTMPSIINNHNNNNNENKSQTTSKNIIINEEEKLCEIDLTSDNIGNHTNGHAGSANLSIDYSEPTSEIPITTPNMTQLIHSQISNLEQAQKWMTTKLSELETKINLIIATQHIKRYDSDNEIIRNRLNRSKSLNNQASLQVPILPNMQRVDSESGGVESSNDNDEDNEIQHVLTFSPPLKPILISSGTSSTESNRTTLRSTSTLKSGHNIINEVILDGIENTNIKRQNSIEFDLTRSHELNVNNLNTIKIENENEHGLEINDDTDNTESNRTNNFSTNFDESSMSISSSTPGSSKRNHIASTKFVVDGNNGRNNNCDSDHECNSICEHKLQNPNHHPNNGHHSVSLTPSPESIKLSHSSDTTTESATQSATSNTLSKSTYLIIDK